MPLPTDTYRVDSEKIISVPSQKKEKDTGQEKITPQPPSHFENFWNNSNNYKNGDSHPYAG